MDMRVGGHGPSRAAPAGPSSSRTARRGRRVAAAILVGSVLVVLAHLLHHTTPWLADPRWDLSRDRSVGEGWGYVLLLLSGTQLLRLSVHDRQPAVAAWGCLLVLAALDDALLLHERGGGWLALRLDLLAPAGLREQDIGELLTWAVLVVPVLLVIVVSHHVSRGLARSRSTRLALLVACLVAFGAGVDVLHQALLSGADGTADVVAGSLEDGGELLVISQLAATVLRWRSSRTG